MSLKDIQKEVHEWTAQFSPQYWEPHQILARFVEETGELAREINHRWGPKKKKSTEELRELSDEISDVLFTLCCLANSKGIDLEDSWKNMMEKITNRDKNRFDKSISL